MTIPIRVAEFAGVIAKPCPFCGSTHLQFMEMGIWKYIQCDSTECRCSGPVDLGYSGAIEKWNAAERKVVDGTIV